MRGAPPLRYLLRSVLLLVPLMALWWTVLLNPLLEAVRLSNELLFRVLVGSDPAPQITIRPGGDWFFRVPVPVALGRRDEIQRLFRRTSQDAPYVRVRSLQLEIAGGYPSLFTVTLPFFWALIAAAGWTRRTARAALIGSAVLLVLAVWLTAFEVVEAFVKYTHLRLGSGISALLHGCDVAVLNVVPYLTPVLLAVLLQRDLRQMIFSGGGAALAEQKTVRARSTSLR